MDILRNIVEHIFISLVSLSTSPIWQDVVINYYAYSPVILILMPVLSFFLAFKISSDSSLFYTFREKGYLIIIFFSIVSLAGLVMLHFTEMNAYYFIPFIIGILFLMFSIGFKLAVVIKGNSWAILYLIVIFILISGTYIINGAPTIRRISTKAFKSELKETFRGITGRDANQEEKRSFWKGAVGEENPSKSKKDEYWKDK